MPPLRNLAGVNTGFAQMGVAAESIFGLLDEPDEADEGTIELRDCRGEFVFEHVSLRYPGTERDAVHDLSLTVRPGECVAFVGLSGSGKSSLVHMIPRFWNPTSGRILIDGVDSQKYTLDSLRANIATVSQDVRLFNDTIRANILFGTVSYTHLTLPTIA